MKIIYGPQAGDRHYHIPILACSLWLQGGETGRRQASLASTCCEKGQWLEAIQDMFCPWVCPFRIHSFVPEAYGTERWACLVALPNKNPFPGKVSSSLWPIITSVAKCPLLSPLSLKACHRTGLQEVREKRRVQKLICRERMKEERVQPRGGGMG